ncbi:MAG: hypothetical protein HOP27_13390 [Anaerolineales bacterium]|nr:hypothetical protein [Anaerolineales bacterium]
MTTKNIRTKKQTKTTDVAKKRQNRSAQIFFAIFAIILILSMVFSAFSKF